MKSLALQPSAARARRDGHNTWKPLRLFTLYRLTVAGLFVLLVETHTAPPPLGRHDAELFYWTALVYLAFAVAARLAVHRRWPAFHIQVYSQISVDIIMLTLLMHASGGIGSGHGMLLVVTIAGGSLLTGGRMAGFFAAFATLTVLVEQVYSSLNHIFPQSQYPQSGMLGATLFATAVLSHVLAARVRESEALAAQRGVDLANMAQLTEYAIQQLETGVLVIDGKGGIRLMNTAAGRLLRATDERSLEVLSPELMRRLRNWPEQDPTDRILPVPGTDLELIPRFNRIGSGPSAGTLILLEDARAAARQAQQLKLASLGRLTASIAHEVRNPLGAISHAGALLAEAPDLQAAERRMVEIILNQSQRVNTIVENILQLSRRDRSRPEDLNRGPWLERFANEFARDEGVERSAISLEASPEPLRVRIDPTHLHQILSNLCHNGLRHATRGPDPKLTLRTGTAEDGRAWLAVADTGPGVPPEAVTQLFEPFFTTESGGTGLGLYLSRELAACNQARLEYIPDPAGARFRLTFAPSE